MQPIPQLRNGFITLARSRARQGMLHRLHLDHLNTNCAISCPGATRHESTFIQIAS
jgi:hypothetical protein